VLYLGLDDTDSLQGGCTTHLAVRIIEQLVLRSDLDLIGWPRLVRLNPNVPWKTRGNGGVALTLGKGTGRPMRLGEVDGKPLQAYPGGVQGHLDASNLLKQVEPIVEKWAHGQAENTDPGLVIVESPLPPRLYWQRVRGVVDRQQNASWLAERNLHHRGWGNGRGLVGAVGALAWPAGWVSYELLAYREEARWGTARELAAKGEERLEFEPGTFDSCNPYTGKVVVAPRGPDPVLFGLRGLFPPLLVKAMEGLADEPVESWLLWATNQGSDDHIQTGEADQVGPCGGYRIRGRVAKRPQKDRGGHLFFKIKDGTGTLDCAAFEPGKPLPAQLELLSEGDEVEVCGGTHDEPLTLAVEKLRFIYSSSKGRKVANPRCPRCGKAMKSLGKEAGYRCRPCRTWVPEEEATYGSDDDGLKPGWYEPPPGQRRHLARPRVLLEGDHWNWERVNWPSRGSGSEDGSGPSD